MTAGRVDPAAVLQALGVRDARVTAPIRGGWDTALWRVERDGHSYALRVFRGVQAETARRELIGMRAAGAAGLPVPEIHAEGAWDARPALLLSWCEGRALLDELRARPWHVWRLGFAFGQMQARIHTARAPADLRERADLARTLTILRLSPTPTGPLALPTVLLRGLLERAWRRGYQRAAGPLVGMAPFYAWAGAVMVRDLTPKLGRPGMSLEPRHLERVRTWTATWKRQIGLPPQDDRPAG